ncbi:MAG: hypothetical protein ABSG68_10690 [Thermoguttaceae bacterium]|jgi:hypothetical protein
MTKTVTVQAQQLWEYCHVSRRTDGALEAEFHEVGNQGWELVTVIYHKDLKGEMTWTGFFKRPSTGQAKPAEQTMPGRTVVKPTEKQAVDTADNDPFEFQKE